MLWSVLCISSYSKTLSRRIIYALAYFHNLSSLLGAKAPRPPPGLYLWTRWGTFVIRPLICPPWKKSCGRPWKGWKERKCGWNRGGVLIKTDVLGALASVPHCDIWKVTQVYAGSLHQTAHIINRYIINFRWRPERPAENAFSNKH